MIKKLTMCTLYLLVFLVCSIETLPLDPYEHTVSAPLDQDDSYVFERFDPQLFKQCLPYMSYNPSRVIADDAFGEMLAQYRTDLPHELEAKLRIQSLIEQHPALDLVIQQLTRPELFKRAKYPSRLLFVGPSGCGKTTAAKALAAYCDMTCVFIKGSAVGNTYQNSGATLINDLFRGMIERPEQQFLVIIDEFMAVAKFVDDVKEMQQNKTAMALWQALDDCESKRHICIIGTDNNDPEQLADQLKTRFKHNMFVFHAAQKNDMLTMIKECLSSQLLYATKNIKSQVCWDEHYLHALARSVEHLSMREVRDLIEKAHILAIAEAQDPDALVTKDHLTRVFHAYKEPSWLHKIWMHRERHIKNLVSMRAVTLYMAISGMILRLYTEQYKDHGTMLATLGMMLNHFWPKGEKDAGDMPLLSAVSHLFAQAENHDQFKVTYAFNKKTQEYARTTHDNDVERNDQYQNKQLEGQAVSNAIAKDNLQLAKENSGIAKTNRVEDREYQDAQMKYQKESHELAKENYDLSKANSDMAIKNRKEDKAYQDAQTKYQKESHELAKENYKLSKENSDIAIQNRAEDVARFKQEFALRIGEIRYRIAQDKGALLGSVSGGTSGIQYQNSVANIVDVASNVIKPVVNTIASKSVSDTVNKSTDIATRVLAPQQQARQDLEKILQDSLEPMPKVQ